jgi:putative endonuclease
LTYCVDILSNNSGSVLYTGFTSDLPRRVLQHRAKQVPGFTSRYNVRRLVYYEATDDRDAALMREKQIKAGSRAKKIALIAEFNPEWKDLYGELLEA